MLQMMQKKIEAEGEKEKELYEKFLCYCRTAKADLTKAVADSTASVPDLQSQIEELEAQIALIKKMMGAIQALEKGAYGMTQTEFIQQRAGAAAVSGVKSLLLSDSLSLPDHDRETLASFLSEGAGEDSG